MGSISLCPAAETALEAALKTAKTDKVSCLCWLGDTVSTLPEHYSVRGSVVPGRKPKINSLIFLYAMHKRAGEVCTCFRASPGSLFEVLYKPLRIVLRELKGVWTLVDWISAEHRALLCSCSNWSCSAQLHCHWAAGKSQKSRISPRERAVWVDFLSVLKWPWQFYFYEWCEETLISCCGIWADFVGGLFCFWCDGELWHWWWIAVCREDTLWLCDILLLNKKNFFF